jgi:hypothetical protein
MCKSDARLLPSGSSLEPGILVAIQAQQWRHELDENARKSTNRSGLGLFVLFRGWSQSVNATVQISRHSSEANGADGKAAEAISPSL